MAASFAEVVIAPAADEAARAALAKKKNLRLLLTGGMPDPAAPGFLFKSLAGGFLAQSRDAGRVAAAALKVVTKRAPDARETADLLFALPVRSEEHTSELQSLKRNAFAVFGLTNKHIIYPATN